MKNVLIEPLRYEPCEVLPEFELLYRLIGDLVKWIQMEAPILAYKQPSS